MKISFLKYFPIKMFLLPFPASLNCIVDDARRNKWKTLPDTVERNKFLRETISSSRWPNRIPRLFMNTSSLYVDFYFMHSYRQSRSTFLFESKNLRRYSFLIKKKEKRESII